MWTRFRLKTRFDSGAGRGPRSAARSLHPPVTIFLGRTVLLLYTLCALAGFASGEPAHSTRQLPIAPTLCDQGCAVADLDGDGRPDLAVARLEGWGPGGFRYRIDLDLTSRAGPSSFRVLAQRGGLRITPRDVNGDWELDLIITTDWTFIPVGVWINDGHGGFVRNDPAFDPRSSNCGSSRILHDTSGEVFQATVPESSRNWPDNSRQPSLYKKNLTKRLTPGRCDVRLGSLSPRHSETRAPPYGSWQPRSSANAPTV